MDLFGLGGLRFDSQLCQRFSQTEVTTEHPGEQRYNPWYQHLKFPSLESFNTNIDWLTSLPAGVMMCPYSQTRNGVELQFGTNYLGHVVLTHLLLDKLRTSGTNASFSRIVNVSSDVHHTGSMGDLYDTLHGCVATENTPLELSALVKIFAHNTLTLLQELVFTTCSLRSVQAGTGSVDTPAQPNISAIWKSGHMQRLASGHCQNITVQTRSLDHLAVLGTTGDTFIHGSYS